MVNFAEGERVKVIGNDSAITDILVVFQFRRTPRSLLSWCDLAGTQSIFQIFGIVNRIPKS